MKRISLKHVFNMRDLGGYPTGGNTYTAYGRLLRSDAPTLLQGDEIQTLRHMNIGTVIDLRMDDECARNPCALQSENGFAYHRCPMNSYVVRVVNESDIPRLYFEMANDKNTVYSVLSIIAGAENGVLYHCTAGKDRTGLVSALLLSLAGVHKNDILADYQVSYTYLRAIQEAWSIENSDWPAFIGRSNIEYMERFLDMFLAKYQSVERYCMEIGLKEEEIETIRRKLEATSKN